MDRSNLEGVPKNYAICLLLITKHLNTPHLATQRQALDQYLYVAHLAALARENGIHFQVVGGWVLPLCALPWSPEKATALRRTLHHVERCRGFLQAHVEAFPAMSRAEAQAWLEDLHVHHGDGPWPSWWSAGVVDLARCIERLAGDAA